MVVWNDRQIRPPLYLRRLRNPVAGHDPGRSQAERMLNQDGGWIGNSPLPVPTAYHRRDPGYGGSGPKVRPGERVPEEFALIFTNFPINFDRV